MLTSSDAMRMLVSQCSTLPPRQLARATATGKREYLFRDMMLRSLAVSMPDHLPEPEWVIPKLAVERWRATRFAGEKSKGIVDLAVVPLEDPLDPEPPLLLEFKLWYSADALNPSKYAAPRRSNHGLISGSFLADVTKLRAVAPRRAGGRLVVTVVPTLHTDRIEAAQGRSAREHMEALGFPYVKVRHFLPGPHTPPSDVVRSEGLARVVAYFSAQGCRSVVDGALQGTFEGVTVTTDFVIAEVPPAS